MLRSTWKFIKAYGLKRLLNGETWQGYVYCRWLFDYIRSALINTPSRIPFIKIRSRRKLYRTYHGKVLTHELAHALLKHDHDIPLRDLEQIMPYPRARDFILKCPPEIALLECACRLARKDHCHPTQVCMIIGQPFVDFVLEHHPRTSRRINQEEALKILDEEHRRGHVHSAWFKDVCMDRFYALCNCCKCCCGGIVTMNKLRLPTMTSSGYVAVVDNKKCGGSHCCIKICPFNAIKASQDGVEIIEKKCMGCGVCVDKCPNGALRLERDEKKPVPLDVRMLK